MRAYLIPSEKGMVRNVEGERGVVETGVWCRQGGESGRVERGVWCKEGYGADRGMVRKFKGYVGLGVGIGLGVRGKVM